MANCLHLARMGLSESKLQVLLRKIKLNYRALHTEFRVFRRYSKWTKGGPDDVSVEGGVSVINVHYSNVRLVSTWDPSNRTQTTCHSELRSHGRTTNIYLYRNTSPIISEKDQRRPPATKLRSWMRVIFSKWEESGSCRCVQHEALTMTLNGCRLEGD